MKALHENQLISIVLNGQIRRGRMRLNPTRTVLYLDIRGQHLPLAQLAPETEGVKWARGWTSTEAKALQVAQSLAPPQEPLIGDAGKKLIRALGHVIVSRPKTVLGALGTLLESVLAETMYKHAKKAALPPVKPEKPPSP